MKTHTLNTCSNCRRNDIRHTLAKGPLVYRIIAVSEALAALEKEEAQVRKDIRVLQLALSGAVDKCSHESEHSLACQLQSLQIELDRILNLQARSRQTLPEIEIVTAKNKRLSMSEAPCRCFHYAGNTYEKPFAKIFK